MKSREPGDRYAKISRRLYADKRFRSLSKPQPNAQSLFLYLLTRPDNTSLPGLFGVGEAGLAEELAWPIASFRRTFAELERSKMARADWTSRLVWIPNAIKHNPPVNGFVVKGWKPYIALLPECSLKDEALESMAVFLATLPPWALSSFETALGDRPAHRLRDGVRDGVRDHLPDGVRDQYQEQEQEQKQQQEQEQEQAPVPPSTTRGLLVRSFQRRWEAAAKAAWPGTKQDPDWDRIGPWIERTAPLRGISIADLVETLLEHWFADAWVIAEKYPTRHFAKHYENYLDPKTARARGQAPAASAADFEKQGSDVQV